MPGGRPTIYTKERGDRVCELTAIHPWGINRLCREYPDLPDPTTIRYWRFKNEEFSLQYAKAKLAQAELMTEDCIDISDDTHKDYKENKEGEQVANNELVNRSRLRVDTRKWLASKLLPKTYGEHVRAQELEGQNENLRQELRELRAKLDEKNQKDY